VSRGGLDDHRLADLPVPPLCLDSDDCGATDCACVVERARGLKPYELTGQERAMLAEFQGQA